MFLHQLLRRGVLHRDFCEDYLLVQKSPAEYNFFCVFDGCSTGIDSHFASTLWGKSLNAAILNVTDLLKTQEEMLDEVIFQSLTQVKSIRDTLQLSVNELLSTFIILVADKEFHSGEILVFGDGFVSINGTDYQIDQNNQPDYLAYYFDKINSREECKRVIMNHSKRFSIRQILDISISTDGINSFEKTGNPNCYESFSGVIPYLSHDDYLINNPSMLARKTNLLKAKQGLVNQDDIALIRIHNTLNF